MTRRRRYLFWGGGGLTLATMFVMVVPLITQGASQFADPAFQTQWQSVESVMPNFWGPLTTARDGQPEAYVEGTYNNQSGQRLVQYFDKARMELTNPTTGKVTNGLLTVELKTGTLQLGDDTFQQYPGANIGIAGDPGQPGPTYASLGQLPESQPQTTGSVALAYNTATNTFASGTPSTDPNAVFSSYLTDPSGRYGQNIPKAFTDFMAKIPGGAIPAMGYAIGPAFQASITVNGTANVPVIIQPFQRRVLTYTASNQSAFQVEFGNIGLHYYQWRYQIITGAAATASAIVSCTTPTFTPTSTGTLTATPTGTVTATPTMAPICTTYPQATMCVTATYTPTSTGTLPATPRGTLTPTPTVTPICTTDATATVCATATSTPFDSSTPTFTPTVGFGTPTSTYAGYVNVCVTSTPYGTWTATPTWTPDASGTAYYSTYYAQNDATNTAYAATSTALSMQYDASNTAYAVTSTAIYAQTSTAYSWTSTPAPSDLTVAALSSVVAALSATQTAVSAPGAPAAATTAAAATSTSNANSTVIASVNSGALTMVAQGTVPMMGASTRPSGTVIITTAQATATAAAAATTATAAPKPPTATSTAQFTATATKPGNVVMPTPSPTNTPTSTPTVTATPNSTQIVVTRTAAAAAATATCAAEQFPSGSCISAAPSRHP